MQQLHTSSDTSVLGSDLFNCYVASTSLVQDVDIPPAPTLVNLRPESVQEKVREYLIRIGVSEENRRLYSERLHDVLTALRGWTLEYADTARPLLTSSPERLRDSDLVNSLDALIRLLEMASFAILPPSPDIPGPPSPDALPLGNSIPDTLDPTLFEHSAALREYLRTNALQLNTCFPYLFVATRGVTFVRKSGLLLRQKIRALERSYFSWIRTPFALLIQPLRSLRTMMWKRLGGDWLRDIFQSSGERGNVDDEDDEDDDDDDLFNIQSQSEEYSAEVHISSSDECNMEARQVRRIVPAGKLEGFLEGLTRFFLPTFTQEPAHELFLLLYREVVPDKELIRKDKRSALVNQLKNSIAQAINPLPSKKDKSQRFAQDAKPSSILDDLKKPRGELKPVSLQLFADVQWGTVYHLFPSTYVLPATRDLLRVDAVTFLGLATTVVTYLRNSDSPFVYPLLLASVVSYLIRVGFGWRQAVVAYERRLATEKSDALVSRQRSALDFLAILSAEELFGKVSCVWLSSVLDNHPSLSEVQNEVLGGVSLHEEVDETWQSWLRERGLLS